MDGKASWHEVGDGRGARAGGGLVAGVYKKTEGCHRTHRLPFHGRGTAVSSGGGSGRSKHSKKSPSVEFHFHDWCLRRAILAGVHCGGNDFLFQGLEN